MVVIFPLLLFVASLGEAIPTVGVGQLDQRMPLDKRQSTPSSQGLHDGFFYFWWSDGQAPATYENLANGSYRLEWESGGNLIGGKGWNPGLDDRAIQISGTYQGVGNSYLAIYGWIRDPLVEYYIIEYHGVFDPTFDAQRLGSVTCDGSVYDIARSIRVGDGSIGGSQTFHRYWSVRRNKRTTGTVQTACHFDAWRNAGLAVGNLDFQIVATEGYFSSGFAEITVANVS